MSGLVRQTGIYLRGVGGARPRVPVDPADLEGAARRWMRKPAFAYVAAGAGGSATVRANRTAFDAWRIAPRMLRDVSQRDPAVELFGRTLPSPFLLAPVGVLELAHRSADLGVARAARESGVPMVISNQASTPMEDIAAELGPDHPRWFQLYWSASDDLVESLVARAERIGAEAIVVTLDTTMLGWRPRDLELGYLPFLRGKGIAQYTSDPVFNRLAEEAGAADTPTPPLRPALARSLWELGRSGASRAQVQQFIGVYSRPSLTWENLDFLRERTKLPIVLKGILRADDARRAVEAGVDGVIVSNHGGRQVDGAIATLEALPTVVDAAGGRIPVLMDSGVRGGADAFKALALGARAVLFGRPYVYGLAIAGAAGAREVIENFTAEFDLTLGLAGLTSAASIDRDSLLPAGAGAS